MQYRLELNEHKNSFYQLACKESGKDWASMWSYSFLPDNLPILPLQMIDKIKHLGRDTHTCFVIDRCSRCYMSDPHGGHCILVSSKTLITACELESQRDLIRKVLGLKLTQYCECCNGTGIKEYGDNE